MSASHKAVVQGYLEKILNNGDWSSWDRYFGERVLFNGDEMTREDFGSVVGYFRSFLPDLHVTIEDQVAEGNKVATRVTFRGTHEGEVEGIAPTGRQVEFRGFAIDHLADGRVIEMWHEMDMHGLFQQLRME